MKIKRYHKYVYISKHRLSNSIWATWVWGLLLCAIWRPSFPLDIPANRYLLRKNSHFHLSVFTIWRPSFPLDIPDICFALNFTFLYLGLYNSDIICVCIMYQQHQLCLLIFTTNSRLGCPLFPDRSFLKNTDISCWQLIICRWYFYEKSDDHWSCNRPRLIYIIFWLK